MSRMPRILLLLTVVVAACSSAEDKAATYLKNAQEMMAAENFKQAKIEARNVLQIQPKNAQAHMILAKIAWRDNDLGEAMPQLLMAVESDPNLLEARLRVGDIYFASGDAKGAAEQAEAARKLAPQDPEVRLLSAKVLTLQGDMKGAEAEIDAALAANPMLVDAITGKASLRNLAGDFPGALTVLEDGLKRLQDADAERLRGFRLGFLLANGRQDAYESNLIDLIKAFPDKTNYRYQLLDFYTAEKRRADQERVMRELLAADPKNYPIKLRLANLILLNGDPAGAEKLLKDSLAESPDSIDLQLGLGDFYRYRKQGKEAMAAYQQTAAKWPETTPEGIRARNRIVAQHVVDGNITQARTDIGKILAAAPDDPDALLARATFSFYDKQYTEAIADLRTVIRRKKSLEAQLLLARCYVGIGDTVVAKDTYRHILTEDPNNSPATKELALLMASQGEAAGAAQILRDFVSVKPDDPEAAAALVQTLLEQRDISAAQAEAERIAKSAATSPLAQQAMASVLRAKGSTADALARYKAVLERDPNQAQALEGLVSSLLELERPGEAIAYLERYPKGDVNAALLLAKVYESQGDLGAARQVYEQAIREKPAEGRLYVALGGLAQADSAEQLEVLERGRKASPNDMVIPVYIAGIYQRQGKADEAIAIYEGLLKKAPNSGLVANNLASLLLQTRDDKQSMARALEVARPLANSENLMALDTLGWALYRNGKYDEAVRTLEVAVGEDGDDPVVMYHLGKAYLGAGDTENARQQLAAALERATAETEFLRDARTTLDEINRKQPAN